MTAFDFFNYVIWFCYGWVLAHQTKDNVREARVQNYLLDQLAVVKEIAVLVKRTENRVDRLELLDDGE